MIYSKNGWLYVGRRLKKKEQHPFLPDIARYKTKFKDNPINRKYVKKNWQKIWLELHLSALKKKGIVEDDTDEPVMAHVSEESYMSLCPTLIEWSEYALEVSRTEDRNDVTHKEYISLLRTKILPYFGNHIRLDQIQYSQIMNWQQSMGKKYSSSTVQKARIILNIILDVALRDRLISDNPLRHIKAPKKRKTRVQMHILWKKSG